MNRPSTRKIALALAASAIASPLPAQAADGITAHCAIVSKGQRRKPIKQEEIYFVNFSAGKFCTSECDVIFSIEAATDQSISLNRSSADIDPEMMIPNWQDSVTIDRKSGVLTGRTRSAGGAVYRSVLTGRCTFLPSLPFPVATALRSAPSADRATVLSRR